MQKFFETDVHHNPCAAPGEEVFFASVIPAKKLLVRSVSLATASLPSVSNIDPNGSALRSSP